MPFTGPFIPSGGIFGYTQTKDPLYDQSSHVMLPAGVSIVAPVGTTQGLSPNNGAQFGPDTPGTTTSGIQEAFNALPTAATRDGLGNTVNGKVGTVWLLPGVFRTTTPITIPAGVINFLGSGRSTYSLPEPISSPYLDLGGTQIVCNSTVWGGVVICPLNASSVPATGLVMRDMELRGVSPAVGQPFNAPPVVNWQGALTGEISNIQCLEVLPGGGIGNNIYNIALLYRSANCDYLDVRNVWTAGGSTQGIVLAGPHFNAHNLFAGFVAASGSAFVLTFGDDVFYSNWHAYSSGNGLNFITNNVDAFPCIIHGMMFESLTNYLTSASTSGMLVLENPEWNSSANPTTNIPANVAAGAKVVTKFEKDATGTHNVYHVTAPNTSPTAGASPFTFPLVSYDAIYIITTVGGMTALTLDGQALFNGAFTVGQQVYVSSGHTLVATWATTAPVFRVLPQ